MNHCTLFPEGWWAHCCEAHDAAYAAQIGQMTADTTLLQCVAASGDGLLAPVSVAVGVVMFLGVTVFGWRYYRKAKVA